ncbi:IclR family transcriptional regulator [Sphingobium sp. Sx8-8]|uniref:IclR family transcriptional regulator n=1 Tax=Sphingobium sp. Sx8-8 TaxID=2933617 RepID=UPI001F59DBFE|nr:IclR family transcriptional regulator [Sphingobium sp. Sx8-8]
MGDLRAAAPARAPVSSVVQAMAILRHLASLSEGAGVNGIARATGINPSSCFNVLRTLLLGGMVTFDPATKLYRLGPGVVDLARRAMGGESLVRLARAPMARIAERYEATIGLWRSSGRDRLTLIELAESGAATRIHLMIGQRQPAVAGATGRAVLAARGVDRDAVARAYGEVRWRQAPGEDAFFAQVEQARQRGWAEDHGNINHGISTVAATVTDIDGEVRFVLSASIFSGREGEDLAPMGTDLRALARQLNEAITD